MQKPIVFIIILVLISQPVQGGALFALAPKHDPNAITEMDEKAREIKAKEFFDSEPMLSRWAQDHPALIQKYGYSIWEEIYRSSTGDEAVHIFTAMPRLDSLGDIREVDDIRMIAAGIKRLNPILGETIAFFGSTYNILKIAFKGEFKPVWPKILDLLAISGNKEDIDKISIKLINLAPSLGEDAVLFVQENYKNDEKDFSDREVRAQWNRVVNEMWNGITFDLSEEEMENLRLVRLGFVKLYPIFKDKIKDFFIAVYPKFKKAFGKELKTYWTEILELLIISTGEFKSEASENAVNTALSILELKEKMKKDFGEYWPKIKEVAQKTGINCAPALLRLTLTHLVRSPERFNDIAETALRLNTLTSGKEDLLIQVFLPAVKKAAGDVWEKDWPRIKRILDMLDQKTLEAVTVPIKYWGGFFTSINDVEDSIIRFITLYSGYKAEDAPIAWYFKTRFSHFASSDEAMQDLWHTLKWNNRPIERQYEILRVLMGTNIKNGDEFTLAVTAADRLIKDCGIEIIDKAKRSLIFCDTLDVPDFFILYPMMLKHGIPLTPEVVQQWRKLRAGIPSEKFTNLQENPDVIKTIDQFETAMEKKLKNLPGKLHDMVYVPARAQFKTVEQAERLARFLSENNQTTFIRIGALVAPQPKPGMKKTVLLEKTEEAEKYEGRFGSTDNLFLVPVRNPLFFRQETIHKRSATAEESVEEKSAVVGKGVGTETSVREEDVVAAFAKGGGVHDFYGGVFEVEKAWVETAETELKKGFRRLLDEHRVWRDLADFF